MNKKTTIGAYGIIQEAGKFVLVLKGNGPYKGSWDLPGGKVEKGQVPEEALVAKIKDETGLEAQKEELLGVFSSRMEHTKTPDESKEEFFHIGILYEVDLKPETRIQSDIYREDSLGARWFSANEIQQLPLTPFAERHLLLG